MTLTPTPASYTRSYTRHVARTPTRELHAPTRAKTKPQLSPTRRATRTYTRPYLHVSTPPYKGGGRVGHAARAEGQRSVIMIESFKIGRNAARGSAGAHCESDRHAAFLTPGNATYRGLVLVTRTPVRKRHERGKGSPTVLQSSSEQCDPLLHAKYNTHNPPYAQKGVYMDDAFAGRAVAYLHRRGLTGATLTPDGRITGLPGVRAAAVDWLDTASADVELIASATGHTMPYAVFQPRPGFPASAGYVTLSLGGFARLLGAPDDEEEVTSQERAAALAAAVAALVNYDEGHIMPLHNLLAGVDPLGVVEALAALYCGLLHVMLPAAAARAAVLEHLGMVAATGGAQ